MFDFNQMLGPPKSETDYARGAETGVVAAKLLLENLAKEFAGESPEFFKGLMDAIQTEI